MNAAKHSCSPVSPGRYLKSRCRPIFCLFCMALALSLWIASTVVFFHNKRYDAVVFTPMLLPKPDVANGHAETNLSFNSSHKGVEVKKEEDDGEKNVAQRPVSDGGKELEKEAETEKEFSERRQRYEEVCQRKVGGGVANPFFYEPAKLALCLVQKVGCSYWKRIFYFLYNETNSEGVTSPFQIDRFFIHFGPRRKTKTAAYGQQKKMFDSFTKAMFTRDPWQRVWSAYVDKLVLPDSWLDHGRSIIRRRGKSKDCSDDVTFQEFLDYTLNVVDDAHWRPVHYICNPCVFRPQYLGKVENFTRDANHILRKVGLEKLIEGHDTQRNYSEDELRMLTKYHFQIYATRAGIRRCLTHSGVAHRLWKAFVLNGYIRQSLTFPAEEFSAALDGLSNSKEAGHKATELLIKYHRVLPVLSSKEMKQHRRQLMVQEYRKAPKANLEKMVKKFKDDFSLFGYEARPDDIFGS